MPKLPLFLQNGGPAGELPPDPAIRDGLLETMRCQGGDIPLWPLHRARLERSGSPAIQDLDRIGQQLCRLAADCPVAAARLRLRMGWHNGRRHWDAALSELVSSPGAESGVRLFLCRERLPISGSANPGCKSLQRAGYNRAGDELPAAADDGLMLDDGGRVIESLRCNLLAWLGGRWVTPFLGRCGVRGVMRDWLEEQIRLEESDIRPEQLLRAREVALCNSLRGVLPVRELIGYGNWAPGPETRRLQRLIAEELW